MIAACPAEGRSLQKPQHGPKLKSRSQRPLNTSIREKSNLQSKSRKMSQSLRNTAAQKKDENSTDTRTGKLNQLLPAEASTENHQISPPDKDVSQMHQTEHQKSAPMKDEDNEEFESIKEEQEEYFITVWKLHIEEHQRPLIKVEEVPLDVKEEGIDVPMCTVEPLRSEDEGPSGASSGAVPLSCSNSTASFPAENLMAPPPVNRDVTSHLQFHW
ncbi:uncharacterized protein LOC144065634 [Stigmatopora argus]